MKSTKSNFLYNVALTFSNLLFPLISFPYVSRIIGPEGIGKVQFVTTFSQYFVLIAALGIPIYGIREVAKVSGDQKALNKLFSELFIINIFSSLLMLLVYAVFIFSIPKFSSGIDLYIISGLVILLGFTSIDWLYGGLQEFSFITIRSFVVKALALIALFLFVKQQKDVEIYLWITIFSIIGNNIWNIIALNKKVKFQFSGLNIKRHLPILITLFSTSISTSIYTVLDTLILGFLTNDVTVGFYSAAIKLNKIAIPLIVALGVVLMPQISKSMASGNTLQTQHLVNKSFAFICLFGVPISLGLGVFAPEIMILLSGEEFQPAILTMQIASPLVFLIGMGHVFGLQILVPSNNEKYYLYATICGMFTSLILNFLFIQLFLDKGAAMATLAGEFVVSFIAYRFVVKRLKYQLNWKYFTKALLSSILFIPIAFLFRHLFDQDLLTLLFSVACSVTVYFFIQIVFFSDEISLEAIAFAKRKLKIGQNNNK